MQGGFSVAASDCLIRDGRDGSTGGEFTRNGARKKAAG